MSELANKDAARWVSKTLFAVSLLFLVLGLYMLGWFVLPSPVDAVQIPIAQGVLPAAPAGSGYESYSDYSLEISWPRWIRAGQERAFQMVLREVTSDTEVETEHPAQIVLVEPALVNLETSPAGRIQTNLSAGQDLVLSWTVKGGSAGEYSGKMYVLFGFYDNAIDELLPVPLAVVDMDIRVSSLWGLQSNLVIWFAMVCLALWGALFVLGRWLQVRR
jgi:hypothetical protein